MEQPMDSLLGYMDHQLEEVVCLERLIAAAMK
jgi:hypothetical protein